MSEKWRDSEIDACVRTYLWMHAAEATNQVPNKTRVRESLLRGPLLSRTHGSIEFRFQNISAVLADHGRDWIQGYKPAKNVGSDIASRIQGYIESYEAKRDARRLNWLVESIPDSVLERALSDLAAGKDFPYPDSRDYDIIFEGTPVPPKKAIGYAALLHFGAPLLPENFSGGEDTPCSRRLAAAGFAFSRKASSTYADAEGVEFRTRVDRQKRVGFSDPPSGETEPKKRSVSSIAYDRDPKVVAYVENRADGICELCDSPAPFLRPDGTPFLEVHHIVALTDGGADTVENAAALCPNCHRACHHGANTASLRRTLETKVSTG